MKGKPSTLPTEGLLDMTDAVTCSVIMVNGDRHLLPWTSIQRVVVQKTDWEASYGNT